MTYTPVTCTKAGEVHLRVCLNPPFHTQHVYLPQNGWNAVQVVIGTGALTATIDGYISYINDGTHSSLFTDLISPDTAQWGGFYTGAKVMAYALNAGNYHVGAVAQAYTDPDDTTAPSMTVNNVGNAGVTPPGAFTLNDGPVDYHMAGPSAAGGDRISWFEGRTTEVHFLTSDGTTLTRKQAFEMSGGEQFRDFAMGRTTGWIYDGSDFWHMSYRRSSSPRILVTRFKPTTIGDPYDYEKFEITLADATLDAVVLANGGPFISCRTANSFFVQATDYSQLGSVKWLEIAKDGSSYTEYFVTGNAVVTAFASHNVPFIAKNAAGAVRVTGTAYSGDGYAVGTYDLTCSGATNQGHCYARKRVTKSRPNDHGFLIPSGDMDDGGDHLITSGDAGGGSFLWQRKQTDDR